MLLEEIIELMYLRQKGFRYLVRNEIGSVEVFVNKPKRNYGNGYATWVENGYPMTREEMARRKKVELGQYTFIHWEDEPMEIDQLIQKYQIVENKTL